MKRVLFFSFSVIFHLHYGQVPYSFYGLYPIAQSHIFNAAAPVHERFTLGLINTGIQLHNTPFRPLELFLKDGNINQVLQNATSRMKQNDLLNIDVHTDLIFFGIKIKNLYFTAGSYNQIFLHFGYPVELLRLVYFGNAQYQNQTVNILGNAIESMAFSAIHAGAQMQLKQFTFGGRVKLLNGIQSFKTERTKAEVGFYDTAWTLNTDILIKSSGKFDDLYQEFLNIRNHLVPGNTGNKGLALDLAAAWEISPKIRFSAVLADLGKLTWNRHLTEYYSTGTAEFKGLNINLAEDRQQDSFDEIIDSINTALNISTRSGASYTTRLPTRMTYMIEYSFYKNHRLMMFADSRFSKDFAVFALGAQYHIPLSVWFHLMGSYTVANRNFNNFGAGFAVKLTGLQIFAVTDQLNFAINPEKLNSLAIRFGINYSLTNTSYFNSVQTVENKKKRSIEKNTP